MYVLLHLSVCLNIIELYIQRKQYSYSSIVVDYLKTPRYILKSLGADTELLNAVNADASSPAWNQRTLQTSYQQPRRNQFSFKTEHTILDRPYI